MKLHPKFLTLISYSIVLFLLCGCGNPTVSAPTDSPGINIHTEDTTEAPPDTTSPTTEQSLAETVPISDSAEVSEVTETPVPTPEPTPVTGLRDNTPYCRVPTAAGTAETHNEYASIDYSNASEGYIMARYTGSCSKVAMQIKYPGAVTYTYYLAGNDYTAFPLTSGNGSYEITILENIGGTSYLVCLTTTIEANISDPFSPYLYPNQYCNFTASSQTVKKAEELAETANNDLEVVENVYNYIINSISYDYDKAQSVVSGYTSNVDEILNSNTGICLDYAAVMTSMLRSQRIPTRLEVGYVGEAYHAWISTYIKDIGWVNGIVEFDGESWKLMDPTFAANTNEEDLREFIGDGSYYVVKYMY